MEKTDSYRTRLYREKKLLQEINLSSRELSKFFNGTGKLRGEKFLDKVREGEPFEMSDGTQKYVNISGSLGTLNKLQTGVKQGQVQLQRADKFTVVDTKELVNQDPGSEGFEEDRFESVPVNAFKKTAEFGGKPETVAGSTEEVESLVTIFLAAGLQNGSGKVPTMLNLSREDRTYPNLKIDLAVGEVLQHFDSLVRDLEKADKVERWIEGSRATAQKIIDYLGGGRSYVVYRNPPQIYEIFKKLNRRYGDRNKWNPADIWVVDTQQFRVSVDEQKSEEEQWREFNQVMQKAFTDKVAVGISLKSLYNLEDPKLEEFNNYEEGQWKSTAENLIRREDCIEPNFEFQITGPGSCKFLWKRRGKQDSLSFRLVNQEGFSSFNVEYGPSDSKGRGGKAGVPAINYEFKRLGCSRLLPRSLGIKSVIAQQFIQKQGQYYSDYVDLLRKYEDRLKGGTVEVYLDQSPSKMLSKYLSLVCYDNFIEMGREDRYKFLTGILEYSISTTEDAAPFIKVS